MLGMSLSFFSELGDNSQASASGAKVAKRFDAAEAVR
jgi:hypothetical protein